MLHELICIGCPLGCILSVRMEDGAVSGVTGNSCKRGHDYAVKEMTNPTRVISSTVVVKNRSNTLLPVKTQNDIPKNAILSCMKALKGVQVDAPVQIGEVIVEDIAGTGVAMIATQNIL